MGLFSKRKETTNSFAEVQDISGGNLYKNFIEARVRDSLFFNDTQSLLVQSLQSKNQQQTIIPYYLLEQQINYFTSTIDFEVEKEHFNRIKLLIRTAIKNGSSCLFRIGDKLGVGAITRVVKNSFNEIESIDFFAINDENVNYKQHEEDSFTKITFTKEQVEKDLEVFKWGSLGLNCWVWLWPFVQIQSSLLKMINNDKYSYFKKIDYYVFDKTQTTKELDSYFNEDNPVNMRLAGSDITNRIEINEVATKQNPNMLIEYYKQVLGIYYANFGRRWNNDFKKERSITAESELTDVNYDILEKDWISQFENFAELASEKFSINLKLKEPEQDMMGGDEDDISDFEGNSQPESKE